MNHNISTNSADPREFIANYELNEYRYTAFWEGREYEHLSEVHLLQKLIGKYIPKLDKSRVMDIGGAYGRLAPLYAHTAKETILADYSTKELKAGISHLRSTYGNRIKYIALNAYKIPLKKKSIDALLSVRVMHHLKDTEIFFSEVHRVLTPGGVAIIEFAHKNHLLALLRNFKKLKTFLAKSVLQVQHRSDQSQGIAEGQVSIMYNFSRKHVVAAAKQQGLRVMGVYTCSFLRVPFLKKLLPLGALLTVEKLFQVVLNWTFMTPSLFIVLKKEGIFSESHVTLENVLQCPKCEEEVRIQKEGAYMCDNGHLYKQQDTEILDLRDPRPEKIDF